MKSDDFCPISGTITFYCVQSVGLLRTKNCDPSVLYMDEFSEKYIDRPKISM